MNGDPFPTLPLVERPTQLRSIEAAEHQSDTAVLLRIAIDKGAPIETIERMVALLEKERARKAEIEFNQAMNAAQAEIQRIVPDKENTQTHSWYATYPKMDSILRPIYLRHGFSLSFDSGQPAVPNTVRAYCFVSHSGGHTRKYQSPDMPIPTLGPQGKPVMTETHGTAAAMLYAMRYLLRYIFNVAIGQDDTDGNLMPENQEKDFLIAIREAGNLDELSRAYKDAIKAAVPQQDYGACKVFKEARDKRAKDLGAA